jgi:pyruvate kinase
VGKTKMNLIATVPKVTPDHFQRTKIVATIGPATDDYEVILKLLKAGANAIRINFGYGLNEERDEQVAMVRKASEESGKPVSLIQDLQGPEMRLGDFEGVIPVQNGQSLRLRLHADYERENVLPTQFDLSRKVKRGQPLYLQDGCLPTVITSIINSVVHVRAESDGVLISRTGINLPDTDFEGDILTDKDRQDIAYGVQHDFDWVALSFVQSANDVRLLRQLLANLGSQAKIIAKIETKAATEQLEEIIQEADATMIVRDDLAIEAGAEAVPILQRRIINIGLKYGHPTIMATQMLASMANNETPTRAEISDVATAVLIGSDAMMLSDETAVGQYPFETVKMLEKIIHYTQDQMLPEALITEVPFLTSDRQDAISRAIVKLADTIDAAAIVAETKSGATAYKITALRPKQPVIAVTSNPRVAQQLAIVYGTVSFIRRDGLAQATKLTDWLRLNKVLKKGDVVVSASGQHPGVVGTTDTIKVRVLD